MPLCALCDDTEGPEKQLQVLLPCGRAGGSAERGARCAGPRRGVLGQQAGGKVFAAAKGRGGLPRLQAGGGSQAKPNA